METEIDNGMSVVIVDYGSGNLHSAEKALERASVQSGLNFPIAVSAEPEMVASADRIVLPGVGAFADCRAGLEAIDGMIDALKEVVQVKARPFLGICVGMQLMAEQGLEHGTWDGFGWISGQVEAVEPNDPVLKIPHMGWNCLNAVRTHPVLDDIETGENGLHAYFVHSYHFKTTKTDDLVATTDYGGDITALVAKDTLVGTQFHPEKSQALGLKLLENFLRWRP